MDDIVNAGVYFQYGCMSRIEDIPADRMAAMSGVLRMAEERVGDEAGFNCVVAFLDWAQLADVDSEFEWSQFLTREERTERFAEQYGTPEARMRLILIILRESLQSGDHKSADLAARILQRMGFPDPPAETVRPLLYMGTTNAGVAAVVAVYDEFWTEKW